MKIKTRPVTDRVCELNLVLQPGGLLPWIGETYWFTIDLWARANTVDGILKPGSVQGSLTCDGVRWLRNASIVVDQKTRELESLVRVVYYFQALIEKASVAIDYLADISRGVGGRAYWHNVYTTLIGERRPPLTFPGQAVDSPGREQVLPSAPLEDALPLSAMYPQLQPLD